MRQALADAIKTDDVDAMAEAAVVKGAVSQASVDALVEHGTLAAGHALVAAGLAAKDETVIKAAWKVWRANTANGSGSWAQYGRAQSLYNAMNFAAMELNHSATLGARRVKGYGWVLGPKA